MSQLPNKRALPLGPPLLSERPISTIRNGWGKFCSIEPTEQWQMQATPQVPVYLDGVFTSTREPPRGTTYSSDDNKTLKLQISEMKSKRNICENILCLQCRCFTKVLYFFRGFRHYFTTPSLFLFPFPLCIKQKENTLLDIFLLRMQSFTNAMMNINWHFKSGSSF